MTEQTEPTRDYAAEADAAEARFKARMAADQAHEERNRPDRDEAETLEAAIAYLEKDLKREMEKLQNGDFAMASQELAQKETVQDIAWLIEDLGKMHPDYPG